MNPPIPNPPTDYTPTPPDAVLPPLPVKLPLTFLELGYLTITPGALALLDEHGVDYETVLDQFRRGEWGTLPSEDAHTNAAALETGDRLMGVYQLALSPSAKLWIICVPYDHTTILLPEDY